MTIQPGELYWLQGDESDLAHPHVVVQVDGHRVTLCALTTNLKRVSLPGNVLLEAGEGGLSRQSLVEVSKRSTVDSAQLGDSIGALSAARVEQILAGIRFVQASYFRDSGG